MLVDARNANAQVDYKAGQELEGAEAEYQVALGQAEAIDEAAGAPAEAPDATPAAQAHAEALGVDLSTVEGSGADGKITKADVAAAAEPKDDGA